MADDTQNATQSRSQLRAAFDTVAALYDAVRPGYPAAVYDDIVTLAAVPAGADILEIGCGTGQATQPFAERGYRLTCVELGAELAALARNNLAAYPRVAVRVGAFETEPLPSAAYDLVISATAFHWVAPESYPKLARVLRPSGAVALFWNEHIVAEVDGGFFGRVQTLYERYAPELVKRERWEGLPIRLPTSEDLPDRAAALAATGLFGAFTVRRYPWVARYDATTYLNILNTYSNHLTLPADRRQRLYDGMRALIDSAYGGEIAKQYLTVLYVAHRR